VGAGQAGLIRPARNTKNPPTPTETNANSSRYGLYTKKYVNPKSKDLTETDENANTRAETKNTIPTTRLR